MAQPLEKVRIGERAHAHRATLVVDLAVGGADLELAHELGDRTHGAGAEQLCGSAIDHGDIRIVDFLDILGEIAVSGLEHAGVTLGVAGDERFTHDEADEERKNHRKRHVREPVEQRGMARGAQSHDLEGDHGEDGDEDDPAPHARAVDVERRMEPPIRDERGDAEHDQRHDERRAAPVGELLHERGNGAPFVNMFPARGLLLGASSLLALAGGLGCFAARRVLRLSHRDVLHLDFHIDGLLRTVFGAAGHLHSGTPQHLQNLVVVHRGINPSGRSVCNMEG